MSEKVVCPVCGEHEFSEKSSFEYCPVCAWQNDEFQVLYPDEDGCNYCSLELYKAWWEKRESGETEKTLVDYLKETE